MLRRSFLRQGAVLVALGLAGCTGGEETPTETLHPETVTDTRTATSGSGTPSPTASPGESGTPTPTATAGGDTDTPSPTPSPTPTATPRPPVDQEVKVGPGSLSFEPESFDIPTGGSVRWVWESSGHNVRPSSIPDGADWSGTEGGDGTTYDAGYTYTYTFDVDGTYEYYCAPHRSAGMTGSFTVGGY